MYNEYLEKMEINIHHKNMMKIHIIIITIVLLINKSIASVHTQGVNKTEHDFILCFFLMVREKKLIHNFQ